MERCKWAGCLNLVRPNGNGRPRKYCDDSECQRNRRELRNSKRDRRKLKPPGKCCDDAKAAGVVTYGSETIHYRDWRGDPGYEFFILTSRVSGAHVKTSKPHVCEQHQQWKLFQKYHGEPGIWPAAYVFGSRVVGAVRRRCPRGGTRGTWCVICGS
jgi:hypothetical protein